MPTLCILGNSHAAALRYGYEEIARDYADWQISFFCTVFDCWREAKISNGVLAIDDEKARKHFSLSGGADRIDLGRCDAFALVGLDWQPAHCARLLGEHRTWPSGKSKLISRAGQKATMLGALRASFAARLARAIGGRTVILAAPLASEAIQEMPFADAELQAEIQPVWHAAAATVAQEVGAAFIPQPDVTRAASGTYTQHHFTRDKVGLLGNAGAPDRFHMGKQYGAIYLRDVFGALASGKPRPVDAA